ncbi:MAG: MoaD/ThiS family protein [Candidatus Wallbacteria bacterium]|nr:MoaD/ThiS family protein [Candidatus Wallbacteria bacterium]
MPKVVVKFYTALKDKAGTDRLNMEGATVGQVLSRVAEKLPEEARSGMFDGSGKVRPRFTLCLNSTMLDPKQFGSTEVQEGDTLHVMPPIAGG